MGNSGCGIVRDRQFEGRDSAGFRQLATAAHYSGIAESTLGVVLAMEFLNRKLYQLGVIFF